MLDKKLSSLQPPKRAHGHGMKVRPEGDANGTRIEQQTAQKAFSRHLPQVVQALKIVGSR